MRNIDIYQLREKDLRAAYNRLSCVHGINFRYLKFSSIVSMLLEESAPRFYIAPEWAYQVIRRYKTKGIVTGNEAMLKDLVREYDRVKSQNPDMPVCQICKLAVESPAKSFYMSPHRVREIIFNYTGRNGKRK